MWWISVAERACKQAENYSWQSYYYGVAEYCRYRASEYL